MFFINSSSLSFIFVWGLVFIFQIHVDFYVSELILHLFQMFFLVVYHYSFSVLCQYIKWNLVREQIYAVISSVIYF